MSRVPVPPAAPADRPAPLPLGGKAVRALAQPVAEPEPPVDAAALAALAQAFAQRLDRLPEAMDGSWQEASRTAALVAGLPPGAARSRVMLRLFERWCGPLPALPDLATPAGQLGMLERPQLLTRLCALALLARPGVLRCCVERHARQAMQGALGPVFDLLSQSSHGGPAVPAAVTQWAPLDWACVGYADLAQARAWPQRSLRRLARLALPAQWPIPRGAALPPVHLPAAVALRRLAPLFSE